jgi:hypothetical protein
MASVFFFCLAFGCTIGKNSMKQIRFVYGVNTPYRPRGFPAAHHETFVRLKNRVWGGGGGDALLKVPVFAALSLAPCFSWVFAVVAMSEPLERFIGT